MDFSNLTIIIPTLNEEENMHRMLDMLPKKFSGVHVIIVDDGSKDRTQDIVKASSAKNASILLIDRSSSGSKGLTASVLAGIASCNTKFFVVIDADFQHPIEKIKELHKCLSLGAPIAIAIRSRVDNWALYRKIISRVLIRLADAVLLIRGAPHSKDVFSGFFGCDTTMAKRLIDKNRARFVSSGYKVLFDMLKCLPKNVKICEVPYEFNTRQFGKSKAGTKQALALLKSFVS